MVSLLAPIENTPYVGGAANSFITVDVNGLQVTLTGIDGELVTWSAAGVPATVAAGTSGQILTSNGAGSAPTFQTGGGGGINNVVEDTSPQYGGNMDVNGFSLVSVSAGDIAITPDTTGNVVLDGLNWPQADGSANQVIETDGAGQLSFVTAAGGGNVTKVGTPVNNEIGVWTGDGTIEGDTNFQWNGSTLSVTGSAIVDVGKVSTEAAPALAFGDGDSGFYEAIDDFIVFSSGGNKIWSSAVSQMVMRNNGFYGWSSTADPVGAPDLRLSRAAAGQMDVTGLTTLTNTVSPVLTLKHDTSATPANGIGAGLNFEVETAAANFEIGATIEAVAVDTTGGSEDFVLTKNLMIAGAPAVEVESVSAGKVSTTDATVTALSLFGTITDEAYHYECTVVGVQTTTFAEAASYKLHGTFKNDGGVLTLVGAVTAAHTGEDTAAWNATLDASGTDIRVLVTGAAATNINWLSKSIITRIS